MGRRQAGDVRAVAAAEQRLATVYLLQGSFEQTVAAREAAAEAFTLAGCVPWVFLLAFIGKQAGANWESWKNSLHYVDYAVIAAVVIGIVYLVVRARRNRRRAAEVGPSGAEPASAADAPSGVR